MKKTTRWSFALAGLFFFAVTALWFHPEKLWAASPQTSTLNVYANLNSSCNFGTTSTPVAAYTLFFGEISGIGTTAVNATTAIAIFCTTGGDVEVQMGPGQIGTMGAVNGIAGARELKNGATLAAYNLYQDAAHTTVWGDGTAATLSAAPEFLLVTTGTNTAATIYGQVPVQVVPATNGLYSDAVTMTATF